MVNTVVYKKTLLDRNWIQDITLKTFIWFSLYFNCPLTPLCQHQWLVSFHELLECASPRKTNKCTLYTSQTIRNLATFNLPFSHISRDLYSATTSFFKLFCLLTTLYETLKTLSNNGFFNCFTTYILIQGTMLCSRNRFLHVLALFPQFGWAALLAFYT